LSVEVLNIYTFIIGHNIKGEIMKITCFIEYKIDPYKLDQFREYAKNWAEIIPECGGELLGYFSPHEGSNNIAYGLISFASLAEYEKYRQTLKRDVAGANNFQFARQEQFILEEKRSFLQLIPETFKRLPV